MDPEKIAAGLTEPMKRALLWRLNGVAMPYIKAVYGKTEKGLETRDLICRGTAPIYHRELTDLGLAVRAILERQSNG